MSTDLPNLVASAHADGGGGGGTGGGVCSPSEAHRLFRRTLARWAGDLLELRRKGLERPCRRLLDVEPGTPCASRLDGLFPDDGVH